MITTITRFGSLFFIMMILPSIICAQNLDEKHANSKLNPDYIKDYKHLFTTRFYLLSESVGFTIKPSNQEVPLRYIPNNDIKNGLAFFHKWYGVGLAVNNPFAGKDVARKGKSKIVDLRVNAYGQAISAELALQDYQGFFLKNMLDQPIAWNPESAYLLRPDMHIFSTSAIMYCVVNHKKHSFRAAYIQNERQLKSSGSFIIMPSFVYLKLQSDSTMIPDFYNSTYLVQDIEHIEDGKFFTYGVSLGYSYTYVFFKNFYVNLSLIPGLFMQNYDYESELGSDKGAKFSALWLGRAAFGFNSDFIYLGIGGVHGFNPSKFNIGQTNFNYEMNQIRVWIGTRF
ncbi:MAG: hypothetical protein CVU00_04505 [Bacteroidetes bacterium HGW-Bacteroidetes-17]|jgi:hypothetical protein|nr:MAG: hypothetical protein CVU00_04505 [Bacteroidetes bacterium HGW-Bacteroidetes-17]